MLYRSNKTAGAKRGLIETSACDALLPYVAGRDEPPRYALHFGTVDKVGVNPRSEHDTPLAVCAFPLTGEIFVQFADIKLPFAQKTSKHLYLLEIRPEARVFYSTPRFFKQGVGPEYVGTARKSRKFFYSTRPKDYEDAPQYVSEEHRTVAKAAQWGRKLMDMGIGVWVDADNEGILHGNEPSQVMFFSPLSYSVVLSMDNPKTSIEAKFGRDWRKKARSGALVGADLSRSKLTKANLRGAKLNGANLNFAVLMGADLSGADLRNARLTSAYLKDVRYDGSTIWPESVRDVLRVWRGDRDLTDAILTDANLSRANLYRVDLTGAYLYDANLSRANLNEADLTNAVLESAVLTNAQLRKAVLTGATLTSAQLNAAYLKDAKLDGANLSGAYLSYADLTGANLTGAYLKNVKYDEFTIWPDSVRDVLRLWRGDRNLSDAYLQGANLTGANLTGVVLERAVLKKANLIEAQLIETILTGADLQGADMTGARFIHTYLRDVRYDDSTIWPNSVRDVLRAWRGDKDLIEAKLHGANLTGANLRVAKLNGAKLPAAKLNGADLTGANLTGANLDFADLTDCILEGITYDETTRWPDGFAPPPSTPRPNRRR